MEAKDILTKYVNDEYVGHKDLKSAIKEILIINENITRELIARSNKEKANIYKNYILKSKIEDWRKSKENELMWANADDHYYFDKWVKELLESEE